MAEKMRIDDEQIFGITMLKLQAFSLAALEMILGDIVVKVSLVMAINLAMAYNITTSPLAVWTSY